MGYCMPIWISDYTYDALATRISEVSLSPYIVSGATTRWRLLHRDSDGGLRWGQTHEIDGHPPGRETSLGVLNQQGEKIREIPAYAMAIPELDGELLWVPEPEVDWKGLLNEGRWIDLDQVRPALQFELPAPAIDRALPTAVRP